VSATDFVTTPEYDAFGPWILDVTDADQVPRIFATFPIDFAAVRRVVKVPRNVIRRDANPQMDLYDHLLIADAERLTVLSREGSHYSILSLAYEQIAALRDSVNLLDGRLTIYARDGSVLVLPYNGTSRALIGEIMLAVRSEMLRTRPVRPAPARPGLPLMRLDDLGRRDAVFVSTTRELMRDEPKFRVLAAHGRSTVRPRGGAAAQFSHLLDPASLHGLVLLASDAELQIISRRDAITRNGAPVVSLARLVFPFANLTSVEAFEHPDYLEVHTVRLTLGSAAIDVPVPQSSLAESVLRAL